MPLPCSRQTPCTCRHGRSSGCICTSAYKWGFPGIPRCQYHPDSPCAPVSCSSCNSWYLSLRWTLLHPSASGWSRQPDTPLCTPKFNANGKLFQVVPPGLFRQGGKQELHKALPRIPFGQSDRLPPHSTRPSINTGKIHPVDPSYHSSPSIRVDDAIQLQALLCLTEKRACHTLAFDIDPGFII